MAISLLGKTDSGLVIVDMQDKLMQVMGRSQTIVDNVIKQLHLSRLFHLPVILTEQFPKWLGPTISEIRESMATYEPVKKMEFNCCDSDVFNEQLNSKRLKHIILTGIESHVCVFLTCHSLLERGYEVHVPRDAVGSRTDENWNAGLELMKEAGAVITSTETVIFQLLEKAGTKEFKEMMKVLR
jgi:nicotinamidase-related amidase